MWIKVCGLTAEAGLDAALQAGVDAVGFVFAASVRRLTPARAAALAAAARGRAAIIAVTLHPTQSQIEEILRVFRPDILQTDRDDFSGLSLPQTLIRLPVVRGGLPAELARAGEHRAPGVLFEGARSGSGEVSDWVAAARWARAHEMVLAGGLSSSNVAQAIAAVRPFGVDVSSGVEDAPGRKSPEKIAQFVAVARAAFRSDSHGNRSVD